MGYTVNLNHPQFPEGFEFGINGVGIVPNGGSTDVDEESERMFITQYGYTLEDAFKDNAVATVTGSSSLSEDELTSLLPPPEPEVTPEEVTPEVEAPTQVVAPAATTSSSGETTDTGTAGGGTNA